MNYPVNIKVCGLTRWQDWKQLGEAGVQYGGMIFFKGSSRFVEGKVDPDKIRSYHKMKKVGVFVNAGKAYILKQIKKYGLDLLQLHGDEAPGFCEEMRQYLPVIKALRIKGEEDIKKCGLYADACDYFLFDTLGKLYGGNGEVFDWEVLDKYDHKVPFFLSGGISLKEVEPLKAFSHHRLFAVDINSRFEIEPGVKNINDIKRFICRLNSN